MGRGVRNPGATARPSWEEQAHAAGLLTVYVPRPGSSAAVTIDPASGIVGQPLGEGVLVYFEGNRFGAVNLRTYAERLHCAAGRLITKYPTVAQMFVADAQDLTPVGTWDPGAERLYVEDEAALSSWLGIRAMRDEDRATPQKPMSSADVQRLLRNPAALSRLIAQGKIADPRKPRP